MNAGERGKALVREALASVVAQPVISAISVAIIAAMCATILLTTGRTVGAEQSVLNAIDSAGTRSIVVRLEAGAGVDSGIVRHLEKLGGIEWVGAFGRATDVQNAAFPGGVKVPLRKLWSPQPSVLGIQTGNSLLGGAFGSRAALDLLGVPQGFGGITTEEGIDYNILGQLRVTPTLEFLEPLLLKPEPAEDADDVGLIVIVADSPGSVSAVAEGAKSMLHLDDPRKAVLETSENLAKLRAIVGGQLGTFGRDLVALLFGITSVLMSTLLFGLVLLRRKDFGRRRALGATRGLIVTLQLIQVVIVSAIGATFGTVAAVTTLMVNRDPLPNWEFAVALCILAVLIASISGLVPAIAASRHDPVRELRVP